MASQQNSLIERVESLFRELSGVASELNFVSDQLGNYVSEMDAALKKLNLGVSTWVTIRGGHNPDNGYTWGEDLGYAKISSKWGIALRSWESDDFGSDRTEDIWLFNDAPRSLRLESIGTLPALLERLSAEASAMVAKLEESLTQVQEVAAVVKKAAAEPQKKIIARGAKTPEVKK